MKIVDMTDQHLINAKAYWERHLADRPDEQFYMGDSDVGESWVQQENEANEDIAILITNRLKKINREIKKRGLNEIHDR